MKHLSWLLMGFGKVISRVCDTLHECAQKLTQYETQMQQ